MESHSSLSQNSKDHFGKLDQRVLNLLEPKGVLDTYNMHEREYIMLPSEDILPEFKSFLPKKLFFKDLPGDNETEDSEEGNSKSKSAKKKKKKKKKKKSKKTKKLLEQLSAGYNEMRMEVFVEEENKLKRRVKIGNLVDPNNKIKFLSLIKDLIGKDLTRFAVPAYLCEPLSMLQRTSEIWEYRHLLYSAIQDECVLNRFIKVFAFLYIQYACTTGRNKKPFNPLLGETFEYETGDFRLIAEQVSHHPPISAFHVENEDYMCWGHIKFKSKLTGISLDITTDGRNSSILILRSFVCVFEKNRRKICSLQSKDFFVRNR